MINVNGNLIKQEKVLQVKPYDEKHYYDNYKGWIYKNFLEITYENGIVSNVEATIEQYKKALDGSNGDE